MRHAAIAALTVVALAAPALAQDATPNVDLIATFVLGVEEGATLSASDAGRTAVMHRTGPGAFDAAPTSGDPFTFTVVEKSPCLFDITYSEQGQSRGGIEVDTAKLTSVSYDKTGETPPTVTYKITLNGAEGIVQALAVDGSLSPAPPSSTLSTSLTAEHMQEAVAALQAGACPAAA